jgi:hypothetical protein
VLCRAGLRAQVLYLFCFSHYIMSLHVLLATPMCEGFVFF